MAILVAGAIAPGGAARAGAAASLEGPPGAIDMPSVDAFLAGEMSSLSIPGLAVAIVEGDRVVHLRGFGVADPRGRPVTPETPFDLASVSKELTALAVMQQVEAGRLELDVDRPLDTSHGLPRRTRSRRAGSPSGSCSTRRAASRPSRGASTRRAMTAGRARWSARFAG